MQTDESADCSIRFFCWRTSFSETILLWSAALGQAGGGYAAELQRLHETGNYLAWDTVLPGFDR